MKVSNNYKKIMTLKFADVKLPRFKEENGLDYIKYGDNNLYPMEILGILNKSAKHNSILFGKVVYIAGKGFKTPTSEDAKKFLRKTERIYKKMIVDIETFGGVCLECIPTFGGGYNYNHIPFQNVRSNAANTKFTYKRDWNDRAEEGVKNIPAFKPGIKERSFLYYKEYRAGIGTYPLAGYVSAINYIVADIELSKHTLTNAKTGFSPTKFVNFFNGIPDDETQEEVENSFKNKFGGSIGDKIIIAFNDDPLKAPTVQDLGASDLTKEDFRAVDELITGNIYSGHQITNPMLFGIQTPGKLGGASEIRESYEIFKNTYVSSKQKQIEEIYEFLAACNGIDYEFKIIETEPVGINISDDLIKEALSKEEIRERLGYNNIANVIDGGQTIKALNSLSPLVATKVLESMSDSEIRSLAGLAPRVAEGEEIVEGEIVKKPVENEMTNEAIKNLTPKQHAQLIRIVRDCTKGRITRAMAVTMLKAGLSLTDADIDTMLPPSKEGFSINYDKDFLEQVAADTFSEYGESKDGYVVLSSSKATFDVTDEVKECFAVVEVISGSGEQIKVKIKGNPKISNQDLAKELNLPIEVIESEVKTLEASGIIKAKSGSIRAIVESGALPKKVASELPKIELRYSYEVIPGEGPEVKPTTRPFCKKMCELNKFYSRKEIEKISLKLGYSVWDRRGGFWNKGNGETSPSCRHYFAMHVVVKK